MPETLLYSTITVLVIIDDLNHMIDNALSLLSGGVTGAAAASGAAGVCGNQDLLTNLLVYQYLSGNIPGGAAGANPQLAALLGSQVRLAASHRRLGFQIF